MRLLLEQLESRDVAAVLLNHGELTIRPYAHHGHFYKVTVFQDDTKLVIKEELPFTKVKPHVVRLPMCNVEFMTIYGDKTNNNIIANETAIPDRIVGGNNIDQISAGL